MAITSFDPAEMNRPLFSFFDKAGTWGPGCDHDSECEITGYEYPAGKNPPYDPNNERGPYALFVVRCTRQREANINADWWVAPNKAKKTLEALGVHVESDGSHDDDAVAGLKCIVVTGDPKKDKRVDPPVDAYSNIYSLQGTS